MSSDEQDRLVQQAINGDQQAYCQLVRSHQRALRSYIALRIKTRHDVDDLAQEALLIGYTKLSQLTEAALFRSWLYGIAQNLIRNYWRKADPLADSTEAELDVIVTAQLESEVLVDPLDGSLSALQQCIEALDESLKMLMQQFYMQEQSLKQLTEQYDVKHSTLTMRLHRTRDRLRQCVLNKLARGEQ